MTTIAAVLRAVAPQANASFVAASANLGSIMAEYGITTPTAQAMLIGQCAHESGFKHFQENLNYSAERLCQVWPSRFPSVAEARPYAKNGRALANKVYNGRMGNRIGTDDGWDYRGSAIIHHTGRVEFERVQNRTKLPVVSSPDTLRDPDRADAMWRAACSYFVDRGALAAANEGNVEQVTLKVNGGRIGLADRKILFARAMAAFDGVPIASGQTTVEQSDDAKRKAKQTATTAAAGAAPTTVGTATQAGDADWSTAIAIGLIVLVAGLCVAGFFWRRHKAKSEEVEEMQLQSIDSRLSMSGAK